MVVEEGIKNDLEVLEEQLRSKKLKNKGNILQFIYTYNSTNPNVSKSMGNKYMEISKPRKRWAKYSLNTNSLVV